MSTLVNCNVKISELIYILKQETKLLKTGKLIGLDDIIQLKTRRLAELEILTAEIKDSKNFTHIAPQIEQLKRMANENGVMLKSVMNGLRAARERLKALQYKEAQVGAYDQRGTGLLISENHILSEKRV